MYSVLIVEDNMMQATAIKNLLTSSQPDINVYIAVNYVTAVTILREYDIHLFILDIQLDVYTDEDDGIQLGKYIRTIPQYTYTPILYITSIPDKIIDAVNDIHCYNYLLKPYRSEELVQSVQKLLESPMVHSEPLKLKDLQGVFFRVELKELIHISCNRKILQLYTTNTEYQTRDLSLEQLLKKLPSNFLRNVI